MISYHSQCLDSAMLKKPIYYKEAKAYVVGVERNAFHIECNQHEAVVLTDHMPLRWAKHNMKGQVSAWAVEKIQHLPHRIVVVRGKNNRTADALTRVPMLRPRRPLASVMHETLMKYAPAWKESLRLWVWSTTFTAEMAAMWQEWRTQECGLYIVSQGNSQL